MVDWKIGPTFPAELVAAGVSLDGYGWDYMAGSFTFNDDVPQSVRDAVTAVYTAHDPARQTIPPTPYPPGTVSTTTWKIPRLQVINRLADAGKFAAFMDSLDDSNQLKRELWHAMDMVPNDAAFVIALLQEAGADPAAILARP